MSTIWASPLPATLQGADGRLRDVNLAFSTLLGRPRASLIGVDPVELEPPEDREASRMQPATGGSARRRLQAVDGSFRWFQTTVLPIAAVAARAGRVGRLCLWQDCSAEVEARELERRAQDELASWLELSGAAMLEYDPTGLIVRCNAAFDALIHPLPQVLADTPPELQALLGWQPTSAVESGGRRQGAPLPGLVPGAPPLERQALVPDAEGRQRRLGARLSCRLGDRGERRIIAVLQDRSAEDERDLARLEMGMLMDAAGIGVATYDPARGWLEPQRAAFAGGHGEVSAATPAPRAAPALQGIGRELVDPGSLPEFERLQRALRSGERTEVRYAVQHPDLGPRWLLTRVEPGVLAGGRVTTSVVTLDVTDQERAQRRNDQLLRELSTILDSSTAGIAYLRAPSARRGSIGTPNGTVLVRCNRRFERMLGYEPGAAAGASLEEILNRGIGERADADEALAALAEGRPFEAELPLARAEGPPQWYSLSVRRADPEGPEPEAVAVLTDITRLKLQQAEQERLLRDRELMFNLSEVGIVYQRGARIERANEAMATLTGYASPELAMLDAADLYENARACVAFESKIEHGLLEHGRFVGERPLRRRDGSLSWVQVGVRPVDMEHPEQGVICTFVDVDERRQSRETLALQADRTRSMLNSVLVGIVTVSEAGIQWMNRSARRMFSGELADFVGEPLSIVATPEADHPLRRSAQMLTLPEGRSETFECRLRGRDGREFWVVGNAVTTAQPGGTRELTVALLDIESRRQAENRIAQAQASLQRVIETAPLAIALFDTEPGGDGFRVQQLNQTAASFFGRPHVQLLGASLMDCCDGPKSQRLQQWLAASLADGQTHRQEWHDGNVEASEGSVWDCRIAPLDADGAGHVQLLLVASDVTEQRAAERARLQAAIDQRELLVREVHHRIKNNLQGVAGLLQQNVARHPALANVLSEAVSQVQAIAQVYGLQVGASGPLPLAGLLAAIAQSVQRTFGRTIRFEPLGDLPHLLPEPESIPLALTVNELLTNAIKHSPGGDVRCTLQAEPDPADGVRIGIASTAQLPPGFDVTKVRGGVSGLGLVRALLPRRHAVLSLVQRGDEVVAEVVLKPPGVALPTEFSTDLATDLATDVATDPATHAAPANDRSQSRA